MGNRLRRGVDRAKREQRGLLMGFLPAGFPTPAEFHSVAREAFSAGLDALEVSMPGPAPELDGPLIQSAADRASAHLGSISEALLLAARSRVSDDDAIVALAYASTLEGISVEGFFQELVDADIDAYLLPQHSMAEQLELAEHARERGIEPVLFLHLQEDLDRLAASSLEDPIIYLQSADLRTGGRFDPVKASERLSELAEALDERSYVVCVGFGVRGPRETETLIAAGADGVIIGTGLVRAADAGPDEVAALVSSMMPALERTSKRSGAGGR